MGSLALSVIRLLFIRFLLLSLLDFSVAKCLLLLLSWSVASLRESLLLLSLAGNLSLSGDGFLLIRAVCLHVGSGVSSGGLDGRGKLCVQER